MVDKFKSRYPGDTRAAIATDSSVLNLVEKIDQLQGIITNLRRQIDSRDNMFDALLLERDDLKRAVELKNMVIERLAKEELQSGNQD